MGLVITSDDVGEVLGLRTLIVGDCLHYGNCLQYLHAGERCTSLLSTLHSDLRITKCTLCTI